MVKAELLLVILLDNYWKEGTATIKTSFKKEEKIKNTFSPHLSYNFWSFLPQLIMETDRINMSNRSINGYKGKQAGMYPPTSLIQRP